MDNFTTATKVCTKCLIKKPATIEFFKKAKNPQKLRANCRECNRNDARKYYQENRDKILAKNKRWHEENAERHADLNRNWSLNNREKRREYVRKYRKRHPERVLEHDRRYAKENPEKMRIKWSHRRKRKENLPITFTVMQWRKCLEYFNYRCAVCQNQLRDLFGKITPHQDHWIPLAHPDCIGTTVDNMICLCSTCNLSKRATLPKDWLEQKYGKRKAAQILERVQAYFVWVKSITDAT